MTEELVILETAKLLKEKGFNEYCKYIINDKGLTMETIYIARDEGKWDEGVQMTGELNLFYDTPQLLFDVKDWTSYWGNARKIAQIPSYMYPQVKDKECYVFNNLELYQNF